MNVLIACEESQRVCTAFRERGHNAFSCDIIEPSGGHPEWHILGDCLPLLDGSITFTTMGRQQYTIDGKWDLIIAHPPCTYLTNVATRHHSIKHTTLENINIRTSKRIIAMSFFMAIAMANCDHIAIENPVGVMNTCYRRPDQIIHPYMFADDQYDPEYVTKATCLWLKGLPCLITNSLPKPDNSIIFGRMPSGKARTWEDSLCRRGGASIARSKTFYGIAKAMAEQWG